MHTERVQIRVGVVSEDEVCVCVCVPVLFRDSVAPLSVPVNSLTSWLGFVEISRHLANLLIFGNTYFCH